MAEDDADWRDEERQALAALATATEPPSAAMEQAVVSRLRAQGLLRTPPRRGARAWSRPALAAAALFALGLWVGRATHPVEPAPRYALLLYGGQEVDAAAGAARVGEYGAWAGRLAAAGQLGSAEKLAAPLSVMGRDRPDEQRTLQGYFLLTVGSAAEALEIARACPHLRYGGQVVVQPIDPT